MIELGNFSWVLAGLLLPGLGWVMGARWPAPVLASLVFSALAIFAGVLGFCLIGMKITLPLMAGWLGMIAIAGGCFWWRQTRFALKERGNSEENKNWWLALPAIPLVLVAIWRATQQPLSGADVDFRWNYLAELLVQTGHLDFYPPKSPDDFSHYFWADGIAPLVSSLYAWTYLATGGFDRHWTWSYCCNASHCLICFMPWVLIGAKEAAGGLPVRWVVARFFCNSLLIWVRKRD